MTLAPSTGLRESSASRPMVIALFVSTCLLSIVSWYTTQQGMALYLSGWFALLASLGVQSALVMVAWLVGVSKTRRALLVAVYVITALVSVAFSYVSLYTWFSAKERPVQVERQLYDTISASSGKTQQILAAAIGEQRKHVLALEEMTAAEKSHGYISRAQDPDPYLARIREAVAKEAGTYREGTGAGIRYTAFDRYTRLAQQSLAQMQTSQRALADFQSQLKPLDSSEAQIRKYREVYNTVPWTEVEEGNHSGRLEKPAIPVYAEFVDKTATGQEELMLAFTELFSAPTGRHIFALALAAFIDIIVFLLAYASGPHFFEAPEARWSAAAATLDDADTPVFVRDFLRKMEPSARGMARVEVSTMTSGELQFCLILASKGSATLVEEDGNRYYILDETAHEQLVDALSIRPLPLRASAKQPQVAP
ncbi:MAG: hypothetical protein HY820_36200 [Acidobacteria bacterium]|nr:hypothetical protein [Acidobacteriota bacterium]